MKMIMRVPVLLVLLSLVLSACTPFIPIVAVGSDVATPPAPTPTPQPSTREAQVQSVEIHVASTDPLQVNAVVRGTLTEACATLGQGQVQYAANTFRITVYAISPADRGCVQAIAPFETTIPLDSNGLQPGTYTVIANGVSAVFTLSAATPSPTATATSAPRPAPQGCTDSAAFISDVTIPDYSIITSGAPFTKVWRLKNTGSCTWDSNYLVHYISGATMTQSPGYYIVEHGQTVAPGQSVNVSVGMTAPVASGKYTSYWGIKKVNGAFIPIRGGADGNAFFVKIRVKEVDDAPVGHIIGSSIDIDLEQGSGVACTSESTYFVYVHITADGPATASYEIGSTAGQIAAGYFQTAYGEPLVPYVTGSLVFDQADTKNLALHFVGPYPYPDDITVNLRVNGGEWRSAKVSCQ